MSGYEQAYAASVDGVTVTSSGTSANVAIPNNSANVRARYVRLQVTGNLYVRLGASGVAATTNSMLLSPNFDVILCAQGFTHIAYLQESAGAKLNVTPLEG